MSHMPDYSNVQLKTSRLLLRPYRPEDKQQVFAVLSCKVISDMTQRIPYPCTMEYVEHWMDWARSGRQAGNACEFGLFELDGGAYVGNCGLCEIYRRNYQGSVVFFIHPGRWGQGYATEALRAVLDFGFAQAGLERIRGRCFSENAASRRVMEKAGLSFEGVARHDIYKDGEFRDVDCLSILRGDWETARAERIKKLVL